MPAINNLCPVKISLITLVEETSLRARERELKIKRPGVINERLINFDIYLAVSVALSNLGTSCS